MHFALRHGRGSAVPQRRHRSPYPRPDFTISALCLVLSIAVVAALNPASGAPVSGIRPVVTSTLPPSCPGFKSSGLVAAPGSSLAHPLYEFTCTSEKAMCPPGYLLVISTEYPPTPRFDYANKDFVFGCRQPNRSAVP